MFAWILVFHLIGVVLWAAGTFAAGRVLLDHALAPPGAGEAYRALERRFLLWTAHPGMGLALLSGWAAAAANPSYFLHEGWLWAKLGFAAAAAAATVALTLASRSLEQAPAPGLERSIRRWRAVFMGAVIAALVLVFVKPL